MSFGTEYFFDVGTAANLLGTMGPYPAERRVEALVTAANVGEFVMWLLPFDLYQAVLNGTRCSLRLGSAGPAPRWGCIVAAHRVLPATDPAALGYM